MYITAVKVSRETGKNLPAVKQQTFCDLIMTIIRFFRTRMPALLIGRFTQGPENTALPTFTLCRIKLSQLYVKIKSWKKVPPKLSTKLAFFEAGVSACTNSTYIIITIRGWKNIFFYIFWKRDELRYKVKFIDWPSFFSIENRDVRLVDIYYHNKKIRR